MIHVAICEDEETSLAILENMLNNYGSLHEDYGIDVNPYTNSSDLMRALQNGNRYDIYFLDIIMANQNGIQIAEHIRSIDKRARLIFTTSSKEHALDAFRVGATQYLVKPLERAQVYDLMDSLLTSFNKNVPSILVNSTQGRLSVPLETILYTEYYQHVVTYILTDGRKLTSKSLRVPFGEAVAPMLAHRGFIQSHKSFVINLAHVSSYTPVKFFISDRIAVPISKSYRTQARNAYVEFMSTVAKK